MTSTEIVGFAGAFAFVAFVFACLHVTSKWGAATKKREEEYENAASVDVLDEQGQTLTIVRSKLVDAQSEPTKSDDNTTGTT